MRSMSAILALLLAGCIADMRPAAYSANKHVGAALVAMRAQHIPAGERLELANFHASRAAMFTSLFVKREGAPDVVPVIPRTPEDRREIEEQDLLLKELEGEIDTELDLKAKARGAWTGILAGLGVSGGGGMLALFLQHRKKLLALLDTVKAKDRAIDQYDVAMDGLPKAKRIALGQGVDLRREHDVRRNGSVAG